MSEFVIRACKNLMNSCYSDGREALNECSNSSTDEKCYNVKDCYLKKIAQNLLRVVNADTCSRCDGCGYDEGCADVECGTFEAYKCLDLLNIEFVGEEQDDI